MHVLDQHLSTKMNVTTLCIDNQLILYWVCAQVQRKTQQGLVSVKQSWE